MCCGMVELVFVKMPEREFSVLGWERLYCKEKVGYVCWVQEKT
jgi:hypothetical protein